jgi:hypothetical protein
MNKYKLLKLKNLKKYELRLRKKKKQCIKKKIKFDCKLNFYNNEGILLSLINFSNKTK